MNSRLPRILSCDVDLELRRCRANRTHCMSQVLRKTEGLLIRPGDHLPRRNIKLWYSENSLRSSDGYSPVYS